MTFDPETGKQVFKIEKRIKFNSNDNEDGDSKIDSGKNDGIVDNNTNVKSGTSWTQWLGSWVI